MRIHSEHREVLLQKLRHMYFSRLLLWGIVCFGIILHSSQYLFNRSLWVDEASIVLMVIDESYSEFLKPSETPIGFLIAEKFLVQILGDSEYVLRLIPFLSGILALLLFLKMAPYFINPTAVPIALVLFATSGPFIYYSSALKQYSSDVVITLVLYSIAINLLTKRSIMLQTFIFGVVGAGAIWFSHPAMLVITGLGGCISLFWLIKKEWLKIRIVTIAYGFWIASFVVLYFISLRVAVTYEAGQQFWVDHFMPLPPSSFVDIAWFIKIFFEFVGYAIRIPMFKTFLGLVEHIYGIFASLLGLTPSIRASLPEILWLLLSGFGWLSLYLIGGSIGLVGCFSLLSQSKEKWLLLISPILITLIASGLHKYPFGTRLILFLLPSLYVFLGEGCSWIRKKSRETFPLAGFALILVLCGPIIVFASQELFSPGTHEESRPVIRYLLEHKQAGDTLYVYYASEGVFKYYARRFDFHEPYIQGVMSRENWNNYIRDLQQLRGKKRVWLFFSHAYAEEAFFLFYLDTIGKRLDSFKDVRASVYLYDLS